MRYFPVFRTKDAFRLKSGGLRIGNIPIYDLIAMVLGVSSALYLGHGLARHGHVRHRGTDLPDGQSEHDSDLIFGSILIVLVLDITRRTLGWVLPLIICIFMSYALFGPYLPGDPAAPGGEV